jgi:hypothetical protein
VRSGDKEKERIHIYNKRNICFVGVDMHKEKHCAVVIDCWMVLDANPVDTGLAKNNGTI